MEAFQALKSEYIGRQLMGSTVITGAALWALNGNLTGNGSQDAGERNRMIALGFKPLSLKIPGTDQWVSYKGLEPFDSLLGLVGDVLTKVVVLIQLGLKKCSKRCLFPLL